MSSGTALLEREQLLSTEGLVMNLRCGLNEVLKMCTCEEISEVYEFTMVLVFDIDYPPSVLSTANLLSINND